MNVKLYVNKENSLDNLAMTREGNWLIWQAAYHISMQLPVVLFTDEDLVFTVSRSAGGTGPVEATNNMTYYDLNISAENSDTGDGGAVFAL